MSQKPQPTPQVSSYGSAVKGALASGFESALGSLPGAAIGNAVNGLFGMASARMNYKYNKKLMALQNQYAIDAFNRENERQNQLLYNSAAMQRHGLASAGYSTADPSGTGFEQPAVANQDTPSNPSAPFIDIGRYDLLQAAQARLLNEQAENLSIKNRYEVRRQEGEVGVLEMDLQKYKETLPEQIASVKSQYYNLTKTNKYLDAQIDNLAEVTAGIQFDNKFKESTMKDRIATVSAELQKLGYERDIKGAEKLLADNGILIGASDFGTIVGLAMQGKTPELMESLSGMFDMIAEKLPPMLKDLITAFWKGCAQAVKDIF